MNRIKNNGIREGSGDRRRMREKINLNILKWLRIPEEDGKREAHIKGSWVQREGQEPRRRTDV